MTAIRRNAVVAVIVATLSLAWATSDLRSGEGPARLIAYGLGLAGVIVSVGVWRNRPWARRAYWAWAGAALCSFAFRDARAEPVLVKVVVASALIALVLFALGVMVRSNTAGSR